MRSQKSSPWSSTGATAVDVAQQVEGRLEKDEGTVPPASEWRWQGGDSLDILERSPNGAIDPEHWDRLKITVSVIKGVALIDVTHRSNSNKPDFSGKTSSEITSKYI